MTATLLLALGLLLMPTGADAGQEGPADELRLQTPPQVERAPDFTLKDLGGRPVRLSDFRGKIVLLNFWATWCPPCRQEMPTMERLHQAFKDKDLQILAVDDGERAEQVRAFQKEMRITFPLLLDPPGAVSEKYRVFALPMTFIVDREGNIIARAPGDRDWASAASRAYFSDLLTRPMRRATP